MVPFWEALMTDARDVCPPELQQEPRISALWATMMLPEVREALPQCNTAPVPDGLSDTPEKAYGDPGKNLQPFIVGSAIAHTPPFSPDGADPEDQGFFLSCGISNNNRGLDFVARFPQGLRNANEQIKFA